MGAPKKAKAAEAVADYVTGTLPGITLAATAANLKVSELRPCGHNFRTDFDPAALAELAESIRTVGVLQPLVVLHRGIDEHGKRVDEILCGERRWKAAQLAQADTVPCMVHTGLTDLQVLEMIATENLARRDMNAWETLRAYQALRDAGLRPGEIAAKAGVAPAEVSKLLALEKLPDEALKLLRGTDGKRLSVSAGYQIAQKWAGFPAVAKVLCQLAAEGSLSVRQLEDKELDYYIGQKLVNAEVVRAVDWKRRESFGCATCEYYRGRLCLAPAEYDRKEAARIAQAEKEAEERRQQLAARALPMAPTGKKKGKAEEAEAAPEPQAEVLRLEDLRHNEYERLSKDRPVGCDDSCSCLVSALDFEGSACDICVNPKRLQSLRAASTRAENKTIREQGKAEIAQVIALRCADPDLYDGEMAGQWLEHEHRKVLTLALALRKLLGGCSVAGKRDAITMLPTGEDLHRANEPVALDAEGKAIVRPEYEAAAVALREYFNPASTHANRDGAWAGLLQGIATCHPSLRPQILLAAVGAVCCDELEEKIKNPSWYRTEHASLLLGELPTTDAAWRMLQVSQTAEQPSIESGDEPEEEDEKPIPLRVSSKTYSDVYENHSLMKNAGRNAWIFRHGGSVYFAFPPWSGNKNDGEPIQAKRVKEASEAEKEGITLRSWSVWADQGIHLGMVVSDYEGKRWAIIDDTCYEVFDVTEVLPVPETKEPS